MNGTNRSNTGRPHSKRRGYDVPEPSRRQDFSKRFRSSSQDPPPRDEDTDYYGPSGRHDDAAYEADDKYYDNPGTERAYALKGWDCVECQTWNHEKETQCRECGLFASCSSEGSNKQEQDDDLDEFGRRRPPPAPPAPVWPPNFDKHGSEYVLDNRSGMFYESKSKFFYDPSTKLYYSHEKQAYFRHRLSESGKSVYDKVENNTSEDATSVNDPTALTDKQMMMPAISINLKTKALPKKPKKKKDDATISTTNSKTSTTTVPATRKTKEHEADLAKWSERQTEQKAADRDLSKIPKTAKGEPICSLCQRKFPTLDKLFYHERVSELHKTNLAKKQAAVQKASTPTKAEQQSSYVDRAEQRRLLHGHESTNLVSANGSSEDEQPNVTTTQVDPKETLNETNIGNKMLQKLGWQQGKGLGRRTAEASNELQQDWERIERLAAANGGGRK